MSYTWKQVIDAAKREARAGVVGDYAEQYTLDLVEYCRRVFGRVWAEWEWEFSKTAIEITLEAGQDTEETLPATIGEILVLGVRGQKGCLRGFSEREYREYQKPDDASTPGNVYGFVRRGLAASGAMKLLFVDPPTSETIIEGQGKTFFTLPTAASVVADAEVPYFPDHMVAILIEEVTGVFCEAINDSRGPKKISNAQAQIGRMKQVGRSSAAEEDTTPPPDMIRFNSRRRGGTSVT